MTTTNNLDDWNLVNSDLYLNSNETDLLINALNSNKSEGTTKNQSDYSQQTFSNNVDTNPYLDFDTSHSFDWDLKNISVGAEGFSTYPPGQNGDGSDDGSDKNSPEYDEGDDHKRKAESPDEEDGSGKRQETGKKSQKPGRKPLTSEPTTKRKAQNRAAQRAFRERKEKHLKDLEDKVDELQKKSDSANNENSLLKAQVDRLQTELSEYRKRLSSAPLQASPYSTNALNRNSWDSSNNFNFEFPKFGLNNDRSRSTSAQNMVSSPTSPIRSGSGVLSSSDLKSLFSAEVLSSAERASNEHLPKTNSRSNSSSHRQFSPSNTASPASSGFNGFTSSCVTTPESTADFIDPGKSVDAGSKGPDRKSFCKEFQTACGNSSNPVPRAAQESRSMSNEIPALTPGGMTTTSTEASLDFGNFDWLANQNGGEFNPVLYNDYREPQENIMNNDAWFFDNAFNVPELGSPLSHTDSQTVPKKNFMQEIEDAQAGKEPEVVPGEAPQTYLTCNKLWDLVQSSEKVASGEADMDDLCSQLKSKAKCSGSGAVIAQEDVDRILGPSMAKQTEPNFLNMFK